jgi:tyrosinase
MAFTRQNVYTLGGDWADPILWYARGVAAMKSRPFNDPTAWRFFGAIHGFDPDLWQQLGFFTPEEPMPSDADIAAFWQQCQHGSWYFLPWHRGYLLAFEAVVRDAVVKLGGPADWAMPYWNYFGPRQQALPPAFASPDWPDGTGNNPLFVPQRFGPNNDGNVFIPLNQVSQNALGDSDFTGSARGGSPGFGGVATGFSHGGQVHGDLESQPHDMVHVLVGGQDPSSGLPGLMSDPDTAGLDPIFWLHHGNIDRLWVVWRKNPPTNMDPSNANWTNGPAAAGGRAFVMPMPGGSTLTYTPAQMSDLSGLNYSYDDLSSPVVPQRIARLRRLAPTPVPQESIVRSTAMPAPKNVELLGASTESVRFTGREARASVMLDHGVRRKVTESLRGATEAVTSAAPATPDRVFLNLENVRGTNDATAFNVYINVPEGEDPANHPDNLAGSVGLFGVRKASKADDQHAGDGLTFVLDISHVIDKLHLAGALDVAKLDVQLVPVKTGQEAVRTAKPADVSIGRISVFREGA